MHQAQITRANPSCFVFLIDLSASMGENLPDGVSKAMGVADALNRILSNLVIKCTGSEEVRDYFHIGVIGYSGAGVGPAFGGPLSGRELVPISAVADEPARVEQRTKKVPDGAGGLVEQTIPFAVWFDPKASGGTPMCRALTMANDWINQFLSEHPDCFPPIVINVTDGVATDGDPVAASAPLRSNASSDGPVLLFNLHLSASPSEPVEYPASLVGINDNYAHKLFEMSSVLPDKIRNAASQSGYELAEGARGFAFNAKFESLVKFLEIGTVAADR